MIENENTWSNAVKTNSQDEFHKKFDSALESLKLEFGKKYPLLINGKEVEAEKTFDVRSPSDTRIILAKFPLATKEQTNQAI
ncbi:MAG TPA: L-glutamate gamma-semialdehyde dehydrogenase, partial [Candidatus Nitrosotenuis sp.]|nr:L-glutamate gamma-semialdehyde dehydrogenase [Candidatus Nitrosotenuis sp.]